MSLISLLKKKTRKTFFTTPSHGQKFFILNKFRQFYKYDISETDTHDPQVALEAAQKRAAKIYGTKHTYFLTNGSTSGIIASVLSCTKPGENVLVWKDAHPCHHNAVELAGCKPVFYKTDEIIDWGIPGKTSVESLKGTKDIAAVIVTSPTYEGIVSDIKEIKKFCEGIGAYLIVDEAHGALYPFSDKLPQSATKIADFTLQSLHKTAGGLNPTALLHSNCNIDPTEALQKITTTSPSYPLLASIEANINFLNSKRGEAKIEELINNIEELKVNLESKIEFYPDNDPTKILIKAEGMTGTALSDKLFSHGIEDEKPNDKSTLLLTGIGTDLKKLSRLKKILRRL